MKSGLEVATFLASHPDVCNVTHPLLPNHPQHQLALDQHSGRHSGDHEQDDISFKFQLIKILRDGGI